MKVNPKVAITAAILILEDTRKPLEYRKTQALAKLREGLSEGTYQDLFETSTENQTHE